MRFCNFLLGGFALTLASCAAPVTETVARLSASPVVSGGTYTSGGGITVAADVREDNGMTMVCGVRAISRHQSALTKFAERQVLGTGSVYLGRGRVVSNLLFMQQVDPAPSYGGAEARCITTGRAWAASDAVLRPSINLPRQIVADESEGMFGFGGPVVWFRQTGPGAGDS